MSLNCAFCKHDIEDDSSYCDQCGKQLMMCPHPLCGQLCATKFCNLHGQAVVPYVKGGAANASSGTVASSPATSGSNSAPIFPVNTSAATVSPSIGSQTAANPVHKPIATPGAAKVSGSLRLFNTNENINVSPSDGDVLGRRGGQHVATFARFGQISGNHLQLRQDDQKKWWAKDLNSSNGSFLNKARLKVGAEFLLQDGATLTLGDIPLTVEIK